MNLPSNVSKIFIDGCKSLTDRDRNYKALMNAEDIYLKAGYEVYNPFKANVCLSLHSRKDLTQAHLAGHRLYILSQCHVLLLLPGWKADPRIRLNLAFCVMYGIPVLEAFTHKHILVDIDLTLADVEYHADTNLLSFIKSMN